MFATCLAEFSADPQYTTFAAARPARGQEHTQRRHVADRLFRRLMLEMLLAAHDAGRTVMSSIMRRRSGLMGFSLIGDSCLEVGVL